VVLPGTAPDVPEVMRRDGPFRHIGAAQGPLVELAIAGDTTVTTEVLLVGGKFFNMVLLMTRVRVMAARGNDRTESPAAFDRGFLVWTTGGGERLTTCRQALAMWTLVCDESRTMPSFFMRKRSVLG